MEELKRIFLEGNPYFLFLTFVVSLLHSVFDMLAFKNDIGFWRSNKSMEGLSAKSVIINAFCQAVIFLYLLDNETSTVVLLSAGKNPIVVQLQNSFPFARAVLLWADDDNHSSQTILIITARDDLHANLEAYSEPVVIVFEPKFSTP